MTDLNSIFNNPANDDIDDMEFEIGGNDSIEHDLSGFGNSSLSSGDENEYNNVADLESDDDLDEEEFGEDEVGEEEIAEVEEANEESMPVEEVVNAEIDNSDTVVMSKSKYILIEKLLQNVKENNDKIIQLLGGFINADEIARISISQISDESFNRNKAELEDDSRVIEGVFDGENMIGPDGKQYSMPANYASKSKLIEGDIMKLTITDSGTFVYKQIGPIERRRVVGVINQSESGNFYVVDDAGRKWRVLTASVTYYKGQVGDEAVILIPKNGESKWAAVDNVVRNQE